MCSAGGLHQLREISSCLGTAWLKKRSLLVDGSSYLYRAFHALPDLRTPKGEPTGALRGVLYMLREACHGLQGATTSPWSSTRQGKTFRDDCTRITRRTAPRCRTTWRCRSSRCTRSCARIGWPLLMVDGVEADDVIGTLVAPGAQSAAWSTVISTGDKDLAQLVDRASRWINTMSNETLDDAGVLAKFGVRAGSDRRLPDADRRRRRQRARASTRSGPKTAAKWLAQYGSLDGVIAHAARSAASSARTCARRSTGCRRRASCHRRRRDCAAVDARALSTSSASRDAGARCATLYERFGFKTLAAATLDGRAAATPDARARRGGRGRRRASGTRQSPAPPCVAERLRNVVDEDALERWLASIEAARARLRSTPRRRRRPDERARSSASRSRSSPDGAATSRSRIATPGAPEQLDARAGARAPRALARGRRRGASSARTSSTTRHVLANHGIALRGVAHDTLLQSYVLEVAQAARHGQPRAAPPATARRIDATTK